MDEKYFPAIEFLYGLGATFIPTDGKHPVFKGFHERPRDPLALVLSWARANNLALRTGSASNGIVVVDIEKEAEPGIVSQLGLPPTATLRTGGGGMHLYYRTGRTLKTAGPGKLAVKVEFKAEKSLSTVVGSVHPNGKVYEWALPPEQVGMAELPAEFIERFKEFIVPEYRPPAPPPPPGRELNEHHPYVLEAIKGETAKVAGAGEGTRNATLNEAAFALGTLVGARVLGRATAEHELLAAALQCGLPEREARGTIKSGLDHGEKQPRQIPEDVDRTRYPAPAMPPAGGGEVPPSYGVDSVLHEFYAANPRILYHRDIYYIYTGRCYRALTDSEMNACLTEFIIGREDCRKKWALPYTKKDAESGNSPVLQADGSRMALSAVNPTVTFLNQCMKMIQGYGVQPSNLDIPFWLDTREPVLNCLAVENGILNLDTYELKPHTPNFFNLVALPYGYDPDATCPSFLTFLNQICRGDEQQICTLQELFGYCLQSSQDGQKLFVFCGEGQNGKTVTTNVLKMLVGERNCANIGLEALSGPHATAGLVGKLVNFSIEWAHIEPQGEGILKAISGGDAVEVNPKNKPSFSVKLATKFVVTSNQPPHIADRSHGMWRRILVIPFEYIVPPDQMIPMESLLREFREELPGIFNWALEGLKCFRTQAGFTETTQMLAAKDTYRRAGSPTWVWAEDALAADPNAALGCDEAYNSYKQWAEENGHRPLNSAHFGQELVRWYRDVAKAELLKSRPRAGRERKWYYSGLGFSNQDGVGGNVPKGLYNEQPDSQQ